MFGGGGGFKVEFKVHAGDEVKRRVPLEGAARNKNEFMHEAMTAAQVCGIARDAALLALRTEVSSPPPPPSSLPALSLSPLSGLFWRSISVRASSLSRMYACRSL